MREIGIEELDKEVIKFHHRGIAHGKGELKLQYVPFQGKLKIVINAGLEEFDYVLDKTKSSLILLMETL